MPRVTAYLSDDDAKIWDNLPNGSRSQLLRDALIEFDFEKRSKDDDERKHRKAAIVELERQSDIAEEKYSYWEGQAFWLEDKIVHLRREYEAEFGFTPDDRTPLIAREIWDTILSEAEHYAQTGRIFTSPSGRSRYRIQGVNKGKILVERMDTRSPKPSTFTSRTIDKAVERLEREGGERIQQGLFMPVLAQECAAVELHPCMSYAGDWLVYNREDQS